MRWLASQPRSVRYGIPRRMRAQNQTKMTVRVRKSNRGMNNQQSTKQAKQQKPAFPRRSPVALTRATTHLCTTRCTAPRHAQRRLDSSYRVFTLFGSQLPLPLPPSPLLRLPLHHPSRPKGRRPGTSTIDIVSYSAATAITIGQLRASSGGPSCHRSTVISCFSSWNDGPTRLLLRLCCTAPALCFLATPKHGSISASPHCRCSLPQA